jgi:hypothetical protein
VLSEYKKMPSEWLLDEIIREANTVEFPSESNLLFELRSELLSRLTQDEAAQPSAQTDACQACAAVGETNTLFIDDVCLECGQRRYASRSAP